MATIVSDRLRWLTIVTACFGSAAACAPSNGRARPGSRLDTTIVEKLDSSAVQLAGEPLSDPSSLRSPRYIRYQSNTLVVLDDNDSSAVHVFDAANGNQIGAFGDQFGDDSLEFRGAWSLIAPADSNRDRSHQMWIYDLTSRRLRLFDVIASARAGDARPTREVQLKPTATTTAPLWLSPTTIVSTGFFNTGRFALFDSSGRQTSLLGKMLIGGDTALQPSVQQHAYQSTDVLNANRRLVATTTRYSDRLDIYDLEGRVTAHAPRLFNFDPDLPPKTPGRRYMFAGGPDTRIGFIDVVASAGTIYALFSGRTSRTAGSHSTSGRYVLAFDWRGKLERVLKLGVDASSLTLDPAGQTLYTVDAIGPDTRIQRYALPPRLGAVAER